MKLPPIDNEEDLQAWLDGEMSPDERLVFEQKLAADRELRDEANETRAVVALLGTLPHYEVPRSFVLTPEMVKAVGAPTPGVVRLLPAVRVLAVAAMLAFVLVGSFTAWQLIAGTDDDRVTNQVSDASESATGDASTGDGIVTGMGESAASGAVPPEQPGSADESRSTDDPSSSDQPMRTGQSGSSADDQTIWLVSSAGLGVLALALGGCWMYLVRTGSSPAAPA